MKRILTSLLTLLCITTGAHGTVTGKADLGPVYVTSNIIDSGSVVRTVSMTGIGGSATASLYKAFVLRPSFVVAGAGQVDYWQIGMGTGAYIPINDSWSVLPYVSGSFSEMSLRVDLSLAFQDIKQRMCSDNAAVGIDVTWWPIECVSITGGLQYAWVQTRSYFDAPFPIGIIITSTEGLNYLGQIDYWFTENASISFGAMHLHARSRESNGSDTTGYRLGLGFKF
ncbi:MAG: hypothetical protein KDK78_00085 [Chlamydiia bacterium]|nr:hypothetical protein [Chlamydiia bacterium]